ncbi:MAG TPA: hypothetical protein VKQ09_10455 [Sphingomonas sp.]|nr:hypothetical protein [Sphingomonas sp.]
MRATWMMAAMACWAGAAMAQIPPPACPDAAKVWQGARPVEAARNFGAHPYPELVLGELADVALVPAEAMILAAPLGKPVAPGDRGGLLGFHIALTGTYRVALSGKAWIDVVQHGRSLPSAAHAHGEPCSGVVKQLDFALAPGDYVLQLSDSSTPRLSVLLTRLP